MKKSSNPQKDPKQQITRYFPQSKNQENVVQKQQKLSENQSGKQNDVYAEALKIQCESSQDQHLDQQATEPKDVTNEELSKTVAKLEQLLLEERRIKEKWADDYKTLRKKYISTLQMLVKSQELLLKHKMYVNTMSKTEVDETNEQSAADAEKLKSDEIDTGLLVPENDQIDVESHISNADMVKLNSIDSQKDKDSTFLRTLLEILYEDKSQLKCRTTSGRSRNGQQKQAITPTKSNLMKQMFLKRVHGSCAPQEEKIKRMNEAYINRLISNSINNINRKPPLL